MRYVSRSGPEAEVIVASGGKLASPSERGKRRRKPLRRIRFAAMSTADLTRQRLIRAALELFTAGGYHATTTPQIARKAGVAEGTMYRHFDGKQELLNELYRASARWAMRLIEEADARGGSAHDRLARLGHALVVGAARDPAVVQIFLLDRHGALLDAESRDAAHAFRIAFERLLAQGKAEGTVRPGAAGVWAGAWLAVVVQALDRVVSRDWTETHAGIKLSLDAAWSAVAARRTAGQADGAIAAEAEPDRPTG